MAKKNVTYVISLEDKISGPLDVINKRTKSFEERITRTAKVALGFFAGRALVRGIRDIGQEIIQTTALFEGFENAITFLSGSGEEGARSMKFLRDNADKLGISLRASIEGFQTLAGGFKGTGTSLDLIKDIFQKTSIAASAMNLSGERTKLVLLALGQMASKGVVSMEELRRQLGDSLPGAAGIAARSMNLTTKDFNKLVESGQLLSKDFLPRFANELEKTFGKGLVKSTKSVRANLNRMTNSFLELTVATGKRLTPAIKTSVKLLTAFTNKLIKIVKVSPVEELQKESRSVSRLAATLSNSNASLDDRNNAYEELKRIQPSIIAGLNSENIDTERLVKNIREFNKVQAQRIILASLEEKEQRALAKEAKIRVKVLDRQIDAQTRLIRLSGKLKAFEPISVEAIDFINKGEFDKAADKVSEIANRFREASADQQSFVLNTTRRIKGQLLLAKQATVELKERERLSKNIIDALNKRKQLLKDLLGLDKIIDVPITAVPGKELKEGITTIRGAAPKIFNINVTKLIETFTISTETLAEGAEEVREKVVEALSLALADLQAVAR